MRGFGDDFGERGFADAGRAPEDHGGWVVVLDLDAEGFAWADEVLLTGVFCEVAGAHAFGERRRPLAFGDGFRGVGKVEEAGFRSHACLPDSARWREVS